MNEKKPIGVVKTHKSGECFIAVTRYGIFGECSSKELAWEQLQAEAGHSDFRFEPDPQYSGAYETRHLIYEDR